MPVCFGRWPIFNILGDCSFGEHCAFGYYRTKTIISVLEAGQLTMGNYVFLNDGVNISALKKVSIGDYCLIGDRVTIMDSNFHHTMPGTGIKCEEVTIGKNVWIGVDSLVLPGVSIGDHSVIAAHSVVTKHIPAQCIAAGSPAKVVKTFECDDNWIRNEYISGMFNIHET
jgi:acetyltransferase-like isoleucine patch superfamily enzyme